MALHFSTPTFGWPLVVGGGKLRWREVAARAMQARQLDDR